MTYFFIFWRGVFHITKGAALKVADDKTIQRIGARITTPSALLAMNNDDISKIMNGLHAKAWIPTIDINAENYLEVFLEELINHKNHGDIMISSRDLDKLLENIKNQAITSCNEFIHKYPQLGQIVNQIRTEILQ